MFLVNITDPDKKQRLERIEDTHAMIGKGRECPVRLSGWRIGREHARIFRTKSGLFIQDLGQFAGTWVNGSRIEQHGPLGPEDEIVLGPYLLKVDDQLVASAHDLTPAPASSRVR